MKRKTLTLTLVLLSCLALIGVGFASWIISANTTKEVSGNISVDTVTDNRLTIETTWLGNKDSIVFGWKEGTYANNWLKNTDSAYAENLSVTLVVTVTDAEGNATAAKSVTASIKGDEKYTTAETANLVGSLPAASVEPVEGETGVYHVTFTFTWGSAFGAKNPLEYYNSQSYTEDLAATAETKLESLYALKDANFTITLTVTPAE